MYSKYFTLEWVIKNLGIHLPRLSHSSFGISPQLWQSNRMELKCLFYYIIILKIKLI